MTVIHKAQTEGNEIKLKKTADYFQW